MLLFAAELAVMRSSFPLAEQHLLQAITTCRRYSPAQSTANPRADDLWLEFKSRITLDMGLLAQARGNDARAEDCFETVLMEQTKADARKHDQARAGVSRSRSTSPVVKRKRSGTAMTVATTGSTADEDLDAGLDEETSAQRTRTRNATCLLAKLSLLVLKIGQGTRVRLSTSTMAMSRAGSGSSGRTKPSSSSATAVSTTALTDSDARLTALSQEIVQLCTPPEGDFTTSSAHETPNSDAAPPSSVPPSLQLVAHFVQALTKGEITKAKQHLSTALTLANTTSSNHAKCLMLALLANLFLWTRNDQASKMLNAAFLINKGMAARTPVPGSGTAGSSQGAQSSPGDEVVGAAKLGLWVGERLLGECAGASQASLLALEFDWN